MTLAHEVENIRVASRQFVREVGFLSNDSLGLGIPHTEGHIMLELKKRGYLGVQELSDILCLDKSVISRAVTKLQQSNLVELQQDPNDRRKKPIHLTDKGRTEVARIDEAANQFVMRALDVLSDEERQEVQKGLHLYGRALYKARKRQEYTIRSIQEGDNLELFRVIREVMEGFDLTCEGTAYHDPNLSRLYQILTKPKSCYFTLEKNGRVMGGGGLQPLEEGNLEICILSKMYFLPESRGLGLGKEILEKCLAKAKEFGFKFCYLETKENMVSAKKLYLRSGFKPVDGPMGSTGYFACDSWFIKAL